MITILKNPAVTDFILFEAKENEEIVGQLWCNIENNTLIVTQIQSEKLLIDGLCRTAMNYALNRFINVCEFRTEGQDCHDDLLRLGFVQNGNYRIDEIDKFFTSHKNCTSV